MAKWLLFIVLYLFIQLCLEATKKQPNILLILYFFYIIVRNANQFIKNALFEKARQFQILTQQLEMVLPVNLLGQFQVCAISDKEVKICVNNASIHALMRFHQKIIKKRCSEILANRHIRITFATTPSSAQKKSSKNDREKRTLSAQSRQLIESFCQQENINKDLKEVMRKIAANTINNDKKA